MKTTVGKRSSQTLQAITADLSLTPLVPQGEVWPEVVIELGCEDMEDEEPMLRPLIPEDGFNLECYTRYLRKLGRLGDELQEVA